MNVAVTRPYNADFDKLILCQKQEAWKACNLLVTTFSKKVEPKQYYTCDKFTCKVLC
jgi:hypothetical protein